MFSTGCLESIPAVNNNESSDDNGKTILAIGDSLTEGYHFKGLKFHPYTNKLEELIEKEMTHSKCDIFNSGVSGEVTFEIMHRLDKHLENDGGYSIVILLGGTNDLGSQEASEIIANLEKMFGSIREHKAHLVVMTIPQSIHDMKWLLEKREEVNTFIRQYVSSHPQCASLMDLHDEIPYADDKYWDDALHFSSDGYDRMGELLFQVIKELL